MTARFTRPLTLVASGVALALALGACAGDADAGAKNPNGDQQDVKIGVHTGWDEGIAASYLWQAILEDEGYQVELETADPGVVYTGLAGGDSDVNFDMWLPATHADYLKKYGKHMEQLGAWYDDARLTVAVNDDSPLKSLDDLAEHPELVDSRIVGIEPGAGLTRIMKDEVIPTYGLDKMDFIESSTPAMLAELKGAMSKGDNIAVTLWRPHWAYEAYKLRDLTDSEGSLGKAEHIETVGREDFAKDYPQFASWLKQFTLTNEQLFSLENLMFNENGGKDNEASAKKWLADNPEFVTDLKAAAKK